MKVIAILLKFKNGLAVALPVDIYTDGTTTDNQIIKTFQAPFKLYKQEEPEIVLSYKKATAEEQKEFWDRQNEIKK